MNIISWCTIIVVVSRDKLRLGSSSRILVVLYNASRILVVLYNASRDSNKNISAETETYLKSLPIQNQNR